MLSNSVVQESTESLECGGSFPVRPVASATLPHTHSQSAHTAAFSARNRRPLMPPAHTPTLPHSHTHSLHTHRLTRNHSLSLSPQTHTNSHKLPQTRQPTNQPITHITHSLTGSAFDHECVRREPHREKKCSADKFGFFSDAQRSWDWVGSVDAAT